MKTRNMISHTWTIQAEEIESFELFKVRKGLNKKQLVPYVCLITVVSRRQAIKERYTQTSERQTLLCGLDCQPLELLIIVQRDGILRVR